MSPTTTPTLPIDPRETEYNRRLQALRIGYELGLFAFVLPGQDDHGTYYPVAVAGAAYKLRPAEVVAWVHGAAAQHGPEVAAQVAFRLGLTDEVTDTDAPPTTDAADE